MIFVSSSCVKSDLIRDSVNQLADIGFRNIELSGGTKPYAHLEDDLLNLKAKWGLNYLCHNYFPPPPEPFVINLASADERISSQSMAHLERALLLSQKLDAKKFGFHAGFLISIDVEQIGKSISKQKLFDRDQAAERFITNFKVLKEKAGNVELYVENNVVSKTNIDNYGGVNPCFITDYEGYLFFKNKIDFKILVDVAHLKVSSNSLGLDFDEQLEKLVPLSDYIHISDNDGRHDNNKPFKKEVLYSQLERLNLKGKTLTLEIYSGEKDLISSYENVEELIKK